MFVEQKALLASLESASAVIESMDRKFFMKALGSFSCRLPVETQAERLIAMTERKRELLDLVADARDALNSLKPESRRLLTEKYGIDGAKQSTDEKNRNYYRKLALAVGKFAAALKSYGLDSLEIAKKAERFAFLAEALGREKSKSISSANFGTLKNSSGVSLRPSLSKDSQETINSR